MTSTITDRRTVLTAAVTLGAVLVAGGSAVALPAPDAIYAAIDAHRAAWDALLTTSVERGTMPDDADDAPLYAAVAVWTAAENVLIATVPTTAAGLAALGQYLRLEHNRFMVARTD